MHYIVYCDGKYSVDGKLSSNLRFAAAATAVAASADRRNTCLVQTVIEQAVQVAIRGHETAASGVYTAIECKSGLQSELFSAGGSIYRPSCWVDYLGMF